MQLLIRLTAIVCLCITILALRSYGNKVKKSALDNLEENMQKAYGEGDTGSIHRGLLAHIIQVSISCYLEAFERIQEYHPLNITAYSSEQKNSLKTFYDEIINNMYPALSKAHRSAWKPNNVTAAVQYTREACEHIREQGAMYLEQYKYMLRRNGMVVEWHSLEDTYIWRTNVTETVYTPRKLFRILLEGDLPERTCDKNDAPSEEEIAEQKKRHESAMSLLAVMEMKAAGRNGINGGDKQPEPIATENADSNSGALETESAPAVGKELPKMEENEIEYVLRFNSSGFLINSLLFG